MTRVAEAEWWRADPRVGDPGRSLAASGAEDSTGSNVPFLALLVFTGILVLSPQSYLPALAPFRPAMLAAVLALGSWIVDRLHHRQPLGILQRGTRVTALLAGWAVATLPLSYWPSGSIAYLLDVYLKSLAIFWLLCSTVSTPRRLRVLLWALSLMSLPLALTGVLNHVRGILVPGVVHGDVKRIIGYDAPLTGNPNDLALMLNLILPLGLALLASTRRPAVRAVLLGVLACDVLAVILTFSRAGFLTLVTILVLQVVGSGGRAQRGWALAGVALLVLALPLLPSAYLGHLGTITNIERDGTGSAQERWGDMASAMRFVTENPVWGAGLGMNTLALNEVRGPSWRMVHNVYLEHAVELGLPGLALFLILLVGCVRSAGFAARRFQQLEPGGSLAACAAGIRTSLVAFAVAAMFHPVAYHFYFYYIAALAIAVRQMAERMDGHGQPAEMEAS